MDGKLLNRAAVGWAVSCSAFGLLTALPKAGAVLELPSVFFLTALPKAGAVLELPSVFFFSFVCNYIQTSADDVIISQL